MRAGGVVVIVVVRWLCYYGCVYVYGRIASCAGCDIRPGRVLVEWCCYLMERVEYCRRLSRHLIVESVRGVECEFFCKGGLKVGEKMG